MCVPDYYFAPGSLFGAGQQTGLSRLYLGWTRSEKRLAGVRRLTSADGSCIYVSGTVDSAQSDDICKGNGAKPLACSGRRSGSLWLLKNPCLTSYTQISRVAIYTSVQCSRK